MQVREAAQPDSHRPARPNPHTPLMSHHGVTCDVRITSDGDLCQGVQRRHLRPAARTVGKRAAAAAEREAAPTASKQALARAAAPAASKQARTPQVTAPSLPAKHKRGQR